MFQFCLLTIKHKLCVNWLVFLSTFTPRMNKESCNMALTFEPFDKNFWCDHSTLAVLS